MIERIKKMKIKIPDEDVCNITGEKCNKLQQCQFCQIAIEFKKHKSEQGNNDVK
jgi:hypothetical protein